MPTRTRYSDNWVMGDSLSVAGSTPWRIRRPCTGAPGRDFPPDVGATATSGRRSPPEVLAAHRGVLALPPRGPCGDIGYGIGGVTTHAAAGSQALVHRDPGAGVEPDPGGERQWPTGGRGRG